MTLQPNQLKRLNQVNELIEALKPRELEVLRLMAEGRSNQEIAAQLMVEVTTVRWHNRQVYSKLGVHTRTLAVARARDLGLLAEGEPSMANASDSTTPLPTNLPAQATSFVGRSREIAKVRQLLARARLLTLTGPGGTGKTRLALQVAAAVREAYADGIWFVPLAAVQDPGFVAVTIAGVLKVPESPGETIKTSLSKFLHDKQMLLVVDNFEHLVEAAPVLSALLADATQLKFLVTSREVLRIYGEQEYPVPSLTLPDRDRAQASQPAFELTRENAEAVAAICMHLDGLPLALELAAARIKLLAPQQLLARLEQGLSGLGQGPRDAPARQRTLQATIEWSFKLLSDGDKRLLSRLGVFRGGWTLEAMEAVCDSDLPFDLLDGLNSLIDKSLVLAAEGQEGTPRFRMLETVRDYVWTQLESEEARQTQKRHRDWFLQLAERGGKGMQTADSQRWFPRLREEEDNLNAALDWCLDDAEGAEVGLQFASVLCDYWLVRGTFRRGCAWLAAFLIRTEEAKNSMRALALASAGMLAKLERDFEAVSHLCGEALDIACALGDRGVEAFALHFLAHVAQERADYVESKKLYERSILLFQEDGNRWGEGEAKNCLGDMQREVGDLANAEIMLGQSLALRRSFNNRRGVCATLSNLGHVLVRLQKAQAADACFRESLELNQTLGHPQSICLCVNGFAGIAVVQNELERAAQFLGAVDNFRSATHFTFESPDQVDYEWIVAQTKAQLPGERFAAAWAVGNQMSLAQAAAYALSG
jgi:predicted ATPase/DNA-binding CsgD family transcriptional regulator